MDEPQLVVDHLGRRLPESTAGYEAAISVWRLMRGDRVPTTFMDDGGGGGDDDDDDDTGDDLDYEEVEVEAGADLEPLAELGGRWALVDATFQVAAGEAVAVIGKPDTGAETLMHVLDRRLVPDRGRAVITGRSSRSAFHNSLIAMSGAPVKKQAAALAMAARVPRRDRKRWVADAIAFALYDDAGNAAYTDAQQVVRLLSSAASLDPTADVILVDQMPWREGSEFARRCLERLRGALAGGSSVVISGAESLPMIELCRRAIRFENGEIVEEGDPPALIEAERRRVAAGRRASSAGYATPPFDARAALMRGSVAQASDGIVQVVLELETAVRAVRLEPRLVLRPTEEGRVVVLSHRTPFECEEPGAYRLTAFVTIPDDTPPLEVDVLVDVGSGDARGEIGRERIGCIDGQDMVPTLEGAELTEPIDADETGFGSQWLFEPR